MGAPELIVPGTASGTAPVGGTGITNRIPRWTGASTLGDSGFVDDGSTIAASSRMLAIGTSGTLGARVWIQNNSSGNTLVLMSPSGAGSAFGQLIEAGTNASDFALNIRQRGTANPLVYVRGDGNVGIGTASPGYRLDVANSTASAFARIVTTNAASSAQLILQGTSFGQIDNTVGDFFLTNSSAAGNMIFRTGSSTERARIDSSGNVGIGTASPGASLHVRGGGGTINSILDSSTSGDTRTELRNNGTRAGYIYWDASEVRAFADTGRFLSFYAGASERARITSTGNVHAASGTTTMTDGFFYIPAAAGAPTGTPTAIAGRVPMYYDTTNNEFYVYNTAWKKVALL